MVYGDKMKSVSGELSSMEITYVFGVGIGLIIVSGELSSMEMK